MILKFLDDKINQYFKKRVRNYILILTLIILNLIGGLFYIQIINYDKFVDLAENNRIRILNIKAERGLILDSNGKIIVSNRPTYNLFVVKEDANNLKKLISMLKDILPNLDVDRAYERIEKTFVYEPALIYRGLDNKDVSYLMEHIDKYKGIKIEANSVRSYSDSKAFSHIIGYLGEANKKDVKLGGYRIGELLGKSGIEKKYEDILKGENGAMRVEVNNYGQINKILDEKPPIKGDDIVLTIDSDLQIFISKLFKDLTGAAVVLDIKKGELLSLFSAPTYDLDLFIPYIENRDWNALVNDKDRPLTNRAISGLYSPGSIYKPILAYIALKESRVSINDKFYCNGVFKYGPYEYHCWKEEGHGFMNLKSAIRESCDVYFYNAGLEVGIDLISKYSKLLGLGEKTGIDLYNEKKGIFPSREWKRNNLKSSWFPGETIITSIGQGYISITPIQMGIAYLALFNGGYVYKPSLLKEIKGNNGSTAINSEVKRTVDISKKTRDFILQSMHEVVNSLHGTGYRARVKGLDIAGKTGTAQVVGLSQTKMYEEEDIPRKYRDHSWFVSVFPAYDPRYITVVLVEHSGSGSSTSAIITGAIANKMIDLGYVAKK
ncbi:MAG: penicillin-binding protein 2 [Deferribacterota bacterium]|nr:penicillin-binding protein 2 [Deferribacterota bacterium]